MLRFRGFQWRAGSVFLGTLLVLAGCSDIPGFDTVAGLISSPEKTAEEKGQETATDAPFKLRIGDRYTFDNPVERWEVVAIEGQHVSWRSDARARRISNVNPILPPLEWQNHASGSGRRLIRDEEGSLFPMRVGATAKFRVTATSDRPPFGWEHNWICRVDEQKTVETISGPFETFVVRCGHGQENKLTYYYAPKVGNFVVRREKRSDGQPDLVRNLLSFERADGTVVAGIVTGKSSKVATRPAEREEPAPVLVPASQPDPPATANTEPSPAPTGTPEERALASVVLAAPTFGGRDTPPAPLKPVAPPRPQYSDQANVPPPATPAPLAKVRRAVPPPVPKAVPSPRPVAKARTGRAAPPLLGPRAAARPGLVSPRPRVPVPPPQTARKAVPSVPPPPIPSVPKPVAAPSVPPPAPSVPKPAAAPSVPPPPPAPVAVSTVHLASYRSEPAAQEGWTALTAANPDLLNGLKPTIRRVDVAGKGTYYRLYAAPVTVSTAADLCRKLNSRGVFCSPES